MPTPTYIPMATVTLGSSASSVTFSSIPATFRDLVLVINGQFTGGNALTRVRFNSDSGTNYPQVFMFGTSSATSGTNAGSNIFVQSTSTLSGTRFDGIVNAMDYSATDKHKTILSRSGYTSSASIQTVEASATRYSNTAAVTTVGVIASANSFAVGSTFALYGIAS